jgi:hypothetical protein
MNKLKNITIELSMFLGVLISGIMIISIITYLTGVLGWRLENLIYMYEGIYER